MAQFNPKYVAKDPDCKICHTCLMEEPKSMFSVMRAQNDGLNMHCRICDGIRTNARRLGLPKSQLDGYYRKYREENKAHLYAKRLQYVENNRPLFAALSAKSYAKRASSWKSAMPNWANKVRIEAIYKESQTQTELTGIQHHVDHIVPIVSNYVCGLHTEDNLRVMLAQDNISKGNRSWPDMWEITNEVRKLCSSL